MSDRAIGQLLAMIDEGFDHRSWHGPTLRGSLRGVTLPSALWRPAPRRHNIWEIVLHTAYWKYAVRRRLTGEKRGSFRLEGSNWFTVEETGATDREWKAAIRLLEDEHQILRTRVAALKAGEEQRQVRKGDTLAFIVRGIAAHDLYHAGQIQLLKRLMRV